VYFAHPNPVHFNVRLFLSLFVQTYTLQLAEWKALYCQREKCLSCGCVLVVGCRKVFSVLTKPFSPCVIQEHFSLHFCITVKSTGVSPTVSVSLKT